MKIEKTTKSNKSESKGHKSHIFLTNKQRKELKHDINTLNKEEIVSKYKFTSRTLNRYIKKFKNKSGDLSLKSSFISRETEKDTNAQYTKIFKDLKNENSIEDLSIQVEPNEKKESQTNVEDLSFIEISDYFGNSTNEQKVNENLFDCNFHSEISISDSYKVKRRSKFDIVNSQVIKFVKRANSQGLPLSRALINTFALKIAKKTILISLKPRMDGLISFRANIK